MLRYDSGNDAVCQSVLLTFPVLSYGKFRTKPAILRVFSVGTNMPRNVSAAPSVKLNGSAARRARWRSVLVQEGPDDTPARAARVSVAQVRPVRRRPGRSVFVAYSIVIRSMISRWWRRSPSQTMK